MSALGNEVLCSSNVPGQCPVPFQSAPDQLAAGMNYYDTNTHVLTTGDNVANLFYVRFRHNMAISSACYAFSPMHAYLEPLSYCQNKTNSYILSVATFYYHSSSQAITDNRTITIEMANHGSKPQWVIFQIAGEEITPSNVY